MPTVNVLTKKYDFHLQFLFAHQLEERLRSRLVPLGVQPRQARVLDALERMDQASQVKLAREFAFAAANRSTMKSRLLAAGLIEKHVDEQELHSNVHKLSKHGKCLLNQIHREWQAIHREICDVIGVENAENLATYTYDLRNAFVGSTPGGDDLDRDMPGSPSKSSN